MRSTRTTASSVPNRRMDVDVLGRDGLEAGADVVVIDEAGGTSLPAAAEVNSNVRLGIEVADVATSAAVLGEDPQHGVGLAGDADDGSARATGDVVAGPMPGAPSARAI
jgi:hypothetical protein